MSLVITDLQRINALLTRGVEMVYPSTEMLRQLLLSGRQLSLYCGYDPTAPTLHIGHGITLLKLKQFQDLGHKIIFLIGDFTGMIGDPTDKSAARVPLTREQVKENATLYVQQASTMIRFDGENPAEVRYNSSWTDALTIQDFFVLASHFTVPRLLERDMFQKRLEEGKTIFLQEFLYPVMQAFDMKAMGVDGQLGGNDQTFNMLAGRELVSASEGRETFVLTNKLLVDANGKKMGKTEGNMIAFSDTPEDLFAKVMRWSDEMIVRGFELCTTVPVAEIEAVAERLRAGENPRDAKLRLAEEVTRTFLGADAAVVGKEHFASVVQASELPETITEYPLAGRDIVTVLVEGGCATSNSDARRAIDGGGVRIDGTKVTSYDMVVPAGSIVQKGKRWFGKMI